MLPKPNKAILLNPVTYQFRQFQYNPPEVTETIETEYKEMTAPGVSVPLQQFVSGRADEISFDIELNDRGESKGFTADFLRFLYTFAPSYLSGDNKFFNPPPPVWLSYGTFVKKCVIIRMVVKRKQFDPKTLTVNQATVNLTLKSIPYY